MYLKQPKIVELAHLGRDRPSEIVSRQVQVVKLSQLPQVSRDRPCQAVVTKADSGYGTSSGQKGFIGAVIL